LRGIDYKYVSGGLDIADLYYTYDSVGNITAERKWITNDNTQPITRKRPPPRGITPHGGGFLRNGAHTA